MTHLSPLQLTQHFFTHFDVRANPKGAPNAKLNLNPRISFRRVAENSNEWQLVMEFAIKSANPDAPFLYDAEIGITGNVVVSEGFPAEKREQLAVVNGLGLLYSAIREMVLTVTARSAKGGLSLPTLNFVEIVAAHTASQKSTEQSPVAPTSSSSDAVT